MGERKVWEEDWMLDPEAELPNAHRYTGHPAKILFKPKNRGGGQFLGSFSGPQDEHSVDIDRARLAACAPEMARMLVELEWSGGYEYGQDSGVDACCPSCMADAPSPALGISGVHKLDCRLIALLRKAGVR